MILQFLFAGAIVIYRSQFYDDIFRHCFASMEATNTEHSPTKNKKNIVEYCIGGNIKQWRKYISQWNVQAALFVSHATNRPNNPLCGCLHGPAMDSYNNSNTHDVDSWFLDILHFRWIYRIYYGEWGKRRNRSNNKTPKVRDMRAC